MPKIDKAKPAESGAVEAELPRRIMYNGAELEDFDPSMDIKEVQKSYATAYPELTTATPSMEIKTVNGKKVKEWSFKKATGTKG